MIVTARQLDDLHRASGGNGHVTLPYRARLTPLAADWVKARKVDLGYSDLDGSEKPANPQSAEKPAESSVGGFVYWCDGPCGPAKAALSAQAKESPP